MVSEFDSRVQYSGQCPVDWFRGGGREGGDGDGGRNVQPAVVKVHLHHISLEMKGGAL